MNAKVGEERKFQVNGEAVWARITEIGTDNIWGIVDMGDGTTAEMTFDHSELVK